MLLFVFPLFVNLFVIANTLIITAAIAATAHILLIVPFVITSLLDTISVALAIANNKLPVPATTAIIDGIFDALSLTILDTPASKIVNPDVTNARIPICFNNSSSTILVSLITFMALDIASNKRDTEPTIVIRFAIFVSVFICDTTSIIAVRPRIAANIPPIFDIVTFENVSPLLRFNIFKLVVTASKSIPIDAAVDIAILMSSLGN